MYHVSTHKYPSNYPISPVSHQSKHNNTLRKGIRYPHADIKYPNADIIFPLGVPVGYLVVSGIYGFAETSAMPPPQFTE